MRAFSRDIVSSARCDIAAPVQLPVLVRLRYRTELTRTSGIEAFVNKEIDHNHWALDLLTPTKISHLIGITTALQVLLDCLNSCRVLNQRLSSLPSLLILKKTTASSRGSKPANSTEISRVALKTRRWWLNLLCIGFGDLFCTFEAGLSFHGNNLIRENFES